VSSPEKVLDYGGDAWSGETSEGEEVSNWIGIGSLVGEVMDLVEYVFVGA
jgi:hypothetical protein